MQQQQQQHQQPEPGQWLCDTAENGTALSMGWPVIIPTDNRQNDPTTINSMFSHLVRQTGDNIDTNFPFECKHHRQENVMIFYPVSQTRKPHNCHEHALVFLLLLLLADALLDRFHFAFCIYFFLLFLRFTVAVAVRWASHCVVFRWNSPNWIVQIVEMQFDEWLATLIDGKTSLGGNGRHQSSAMATEAGNKRMKEIRKRRRRKLKRKFFLANAWLTSFCQRYEVDMTFTARRHFSEWSLRSETSDATGRLQNHDVPLRSVNVMWFNICFLTFFSFAWIGRRKCNAIR